jgi:membrane-associated phospholipid phosphatase
MSRTAGCKRRPGRRRSTNTPPPSGGRTPGAGRRALPALAAFALLTAAAAPARADDEPSGPAFRLSWDVDATALLLSGSIASSFFVMSESDAPACAPRCDRSSVNRFDRWAAGRYSPAWGTAGDIATASVIAIAPLALVLSEGVGDGLNDSLVVAEAALAASALQVSLSYAVGRPRPRVYGDDAPVDKRDDANAGRSFFSGHVANCVAATVAAARALDRTHRPALAWALLAAGLSGSAFVGVARVGAGSHFPSDVVAGAAAGAGLGLLLPALHGRPVSIMPFTDASRVGASFVGTF